MPYDFSKLTPEQSSRWASVPIHPIGIEDKPTDIKRKTLEIELANANDVNRQCIQDAVKHVSSIIKFNEIEEIWFQGDDLLIVEAFDKQRRSIPFQIVRDRKEQTNGIEQNK